MMNAINQIFITCFLAWIVFEANVLCEGTKRATGYSISDNNPNFLAMDAYNEPQQQQYLPEVNPTIFSDARIPVGYAEGIPYHDMPVNYPVLAAASPLPKYCTQPLYATQLNSGQNIYRTYDMPAATTYDRMALPIVQSSPIANFYMPPPPAPLVKSGNDPYGLPLPLTLQPAPPAAAAVAADPYTSNAFNY